MKPASIHFTLLLYDGRGPSVSKTCGPKQPGDFFIKLYDTLPQDKNFKVSYDNWFTSLELHASNAAKNQNGTIHSNRLVGCDLQSEKQMKKQGRGSCGHLLNKKTSVAVVPWMVSSAVGYSWHQPM